MIASSRNFAIGMVHFKIGGGWLVTGVILGVYLLLFFGVMSIVYYLDYRNGGGFMSDIGKVLLGFIMALQGLALLGIGGYRVSAAIRMDISSRMLESHRLMPVTSVRAVLGYLFGPPTPTVAFVLLNLLLSVALGHWMGGSLERIVINQLVVFSFAIFTWSILCLGTFIYRHMFILAFTGMMLAMCTGLATGAYIVVPGLSLLLTPFMGESVFSLGAGMGVSPGLPYDLYAMGLGGQAVLFLLFFMGSCRLYRGTYTTAFSGWQALALLLVWAVLSAVGVARSADLGMARLFGAPSGVEDWQGAMQIIGSVATCLLLAMVPLWSLMKSQAQKPTARAVWSMTVVLIAVIASIPALGAVWMTDYGPRSIGFTFFIMLMQIVVVFCLLRLVRRFLFILAALIIAGVLFALNLAPVIFDVVRLSVGGNSQDHSVSVLLTLSPMGLLATEWLRASSPDFSVTPVWGCLWQALVAGGMLVLTSLLSRRVNKPVAAPAAVVAPPLPPEVTQVTPR